MYQIKNAIKKVIDFVLSCYSRWMVWLIVISLILIILISFDSVFNTKSTIHSDIASKQAFIDSTRRLVEKQDESYEASLKSRKEECARCGYVSNDGFEPTCVKMCNLPSFGLIRFYSVEKERLSKLEADLIILKGIKSKTTTQLFLETIFIKKKMSSDLPLIYFWMMFVVSIPLFYVLLTILKYSVGRIKLLIKQGSAVVGEIKQMSSFQKYLLILLGLLLVVTVTALIIK